MDRPDGLTAFALDFDSAAEGQELRGWIIERARLPLLRVFEASDFAHAPPGGHVHFCEIEGGLAHIVCRDDLDATAFLLRFGIEAEAVAGGGD